MTHRQLLLLGSLFLVSACQSTEDQQLQQPNEAAAMEEIEEVVEEVVEEVLEERSLDGWSPETIALPPEFAPGLPAGEELLLFAPGMFDAEAEDFWSYVFVMSLDEGDLDAASLTDLFEEYYDGLLLAVGEGRGLDMGVDPASVHLSSDGDNRYHADIDMIEAFVTGERLDLNILIEVTPLGPDSSFLKVQASPQPANHEIWKSLSYAVESLEI